MCGIIAAWAFPISAQDFSHVRLVTLPANSVYFARFVRVARPEKIQVFASPVSASSATPNWSNLFDDSRPASDSKPGLMDMVEFSETPFAQQVRMSLGSFLGGRINLGGFNAVTPTKSIERGLPGGGSLDAWAPIPMGRGGMILPKDDTRYGPSLTFYYAGSVEDARNAKLNAVVTWLEEKNPVLWLVGSNPR
jgi:hypothetical protein